MNKGLIIKAISSRDEALKQNEISIYILLFLLGCSIIMSLYFFCESIHLKTKCDYYEREVPLLDSKENIDIPMPHIIANLPETKIGG